MLKQSIRTLACVALIAVIGALWLRVRSLEATVNALNQRSAPAVVMPIGEAKSNGAEHKPVFKLIDSATENQHKSNVGVPWDVERALMGDSQKTEDLQRMQH
jgi:hypothetical protein